MDRTADLGQGWIAYASYDGSFAIGNKELGSSLVLTKEEAARFVALYDAAEKKAAADAASRKLQEQLRIDYADLGVSVGYIGNFERWGDDRSFRVFCKLSTRPNASCCDVNIYRTREEYDAEEDARVRPLLDRIRARLELGELYHVSPGT